MKHLLLRILSNNIVEHVFFLLLCLLSIFLYQERLLADSGYYLFKVINFERLWVEHNRFILILPQILSLLTVKAGLSLKAIILVYSSGIVLLHYSVFIFVKYYYKDQFAGILVLLLQTLGIMSGFFVPMFELYFAALLLVLFSVILYQSKHRLRLIALIPLLFFILTAHVYANILMLFVITFHAIEYKRKYLKTYIVFLIFMTVLLVWKFFTASEYEQAKSQAFLHTLKHESYNLNYLKMLLSFLWTFYKEMVLLSLIAFFILAYSRKYLKALIFLVFLTGTLVLVNISYYGFVQSRYQEQVYFPLSFLVAYAFYSCFSQGQKNYLKYSLLIISLFCISIRTWGIWTHSSYFRSRTSEIKQYIELARKQEGSKFVVSENTLAYPANWSYPIETMLLSSLNSNDSTLTICTDVDMGYNQNFEKILPNQYLFRRWEIYDTGTLNLKYFTSDNSIYRKLEDNVKAKK